MNSHAFYRNNVALTMMVKPICMTMAASGSGGI